MANESNPIPKEQTQSTINDSASTTSKQPNTPPPKEVKENKNNSSKNTKKNQGSSKAKSKGSTSIEIDERTRKKIPNSNNHSYSGQFSAKQLDELGL